MPIPRQLSIAVYSFGYGGNGGIKAQHPDVSQWLLNTLPQAAKDERISGIVYADLADTPITMCRNQAVLEARKVGADVIVMVDSDMQPDMYLDQKNRVPGVVPFWDAAFDFIYNNYDKGPQVVAAPYGGSPPHENIFVFQWTTIQSEHPDDADMKLSQYTREQAVEMAGIQECAALPTGLIMYDIRAFELTEPKDESEPPWYYYEWGNEEFPAQYAAAKASTEDVTNTRDLSLAGIVSLGYNPVHVAWSSWAGHWKPKCVGRPTLLTADSVGVRLARAARERLPSTVRNRVVDYTASLHGGNDNGKPKLPAPPPRFFHNLQNTQDENAIDKKLAEVLANEIPGEVVELGCNAGNTSLRMAKVILSDREVGSRLHVDRFPDRTLHVYDSFQGMPEWSEKDKGTSLFMTPGMLRVTAQDVRDNFAAAKLPVPVIHEGWLKDVLPHELPEQIAFCLIDVDLYEPTLACLCAVYDRLAFGAICVIHDYTCDNITGTKIAVDEFFEDKYGIPVMKTGCTAVYFTKPEEVQDGECNENDSADSADAGAGNHAPAAQVL